MAATHMLQGFAEEQFEHEDVAHPLFRKGEGPGVVLLHELPGLTVETVEFADYLVARDFHVVLPLLFGKPLQSAVSGLAKAPLLCLRREFYCLAGSRTSALSPWLRALCRKVHAERGGPGVGAIGMCFTGGLVLAMMVDASVAAPVSAQPALPLFTADEVDADAHTLAEAGARADRAPLLALRFAEDPRCTAARFARIEEGFGTGTAGCARIQPFVVPGPGHSTLTFDYAKSLQRGSDPRQAVVEHLQRLLAAQPATAAS